MHKAPKMGPSVVDLRSGMEADVKLQSLIGHCWAWGRKEESSREVAGLAGWIMVVTWAGVMAVEG